MLVTTGLAVLGVVLLFVLGLGAFGVLGARGSQPAKSTLVAKGALPDNSPLAARARTPDTPLARTAQAPTKVQMPADVLAWLEHLRKSEEHREKVTTGQLGTALKERAGLELSGGGKDLAEQLLNGIDDPNSEMKPPTEKLGQVFKQMKDEYAQVTQYFMSMPPPAECRPIQEAYQQALTETTEQIGNISDAMAAGNMEALLNMRGKSNQGIDTPGKKTDRLVGEICAKYDTPRWFYIKSDITTGGMFGVGF